MNEELQKALGELLNKANNGIDAASGFLAAELPDVIQQLLTWYVVENTIWFMCNVLLTFAFYKATVEFNKLRKENIREMYDIPMILTAIGLIVTTMVAITCGVEALKIYIAPKLWLLEYAASLTK